MRRSYYGHKQILWNFWGKMLIVKYASCITKQVVAVYTPRRHASMNLFWDENLGMEEQKLKTRPAATLEF